MTHNRSSLRICGLTHTNTNMGWHCSGASALCRVTEDPKKAPTIFLSNICFSHQMLHPDAWLCFGQHLEQQKELEEESIYWVMHSLELE